MLIFAEWWDRQLFLFINLWSLWKAFESMENDNNKEMMLDNCLPSLLWMVNCTMGYAWQHEEVSCCWQRAFCKACVIAEVLLVFLLIHYYHFLYNFCIILLTLISFHDPERHLLLAQGRGFFTALMCWKSPWANTHLKANMPSNSIWCRQPGAHGEKSGSEAD